MHVVISYASQAVAACRVAAALAACAGLQIPHLSAPGTGSSAQWHRHSSSAGSSVASRLRQAWWCAYFQNLHPCEGPQMQQLAGERVLSVGVQAGVALVNNTAEDTLARCCAG